MKVGVVHTCHPSDLVTQQRGYMCVPGQLGQCSELQARLIQQAPGGKGLNEQVW